MGKAKNLTKANRALAIGITLTIAAPFFFTLPAIFKNYSFGPPNNIGDTIGGITAPIVGILGSLLVYYALREQVKANKIITRQFEAEIESRNLNQLYAYIERSIENFTYKNNAQGSLVEAKRNDGVALSAEAFHHLLSELYCIHLSEEELMQNPSVAELYSILKAMNILLDRIAKTEKNSESILVTLIKHQFEYRIFSRHYGTQDESLKKKPCKECNMDHGIPEKILELIREIRRKTAE